MPTKRPSTATSTSGISSEMIDSAARVGAKPNSRNARIVTVIGRSPGLGEEQRQVHVGEAVDEGEDHAGEDARHQQRQRHVAQHATAAARRGWPPPLRRWSGIVCRLIATVRTLNGRQMTTWPISSAQKPIQLPEADDGQELQQRDAGDQGRQDQRPERHRAHDALAGKLVAHARRRRAARRSPVATARSARRARG